MKKQQEKKTRNQQLTAKQSSHSSRSGDVTDGQLTFIEHFYELRSRLFWVVTSLILASAVGFHFKDYLVKFVVAPLGGEKLVYLTPGGGFSFIFTVCLYFGALLTIPVIVYHIYRFLQPVLGKTSRRLVVAIVFMSCVLAASGAVFGYMAAIPAAINFLMTFAGDAVSPSLTAESYLGFVVAYMLGLAALFQLPLLLFIFDHVKPFPPGALLSSQRFVIVGAIIAAAIITPTPDIVNQLIIAVPIIVIYQLGAVAIYIRRTLRQRSKSHVPSAKNVSTESSVDNAKPVLSPTHATTVRSVAPSVAVPPITPAPAPRRRSMDGVTRSVARTTLAVQNRNTTAVQRSSAMRSSVSQKSIDPVLPRRPLRTTDGFSTAS